jgi:hypothetical protein
MTTPRTLTFTLFLLASATASQAQMRPATPVKPAKPAVRYDPTLPDLVFIDAGGGYRFNSLNFTESRTEPYFAETKSWTADYSVKNGPLFAIGGGARVWRHVVVGATFTHFKDDEPATITGKIPNPFFFNKDRTISGTADALAHQEQTLHLSGIWRSRVTPAFELGVFGGPSFISLKRDFVSDVQFQEAYPFDTATFTGAVTSEVSKSCLGFHVGADLAWFFTRNIGVSGAVRFSRATADLTTPAGNATSLDVGGTDATVGVRISLGGRPGEKKGTKVVHRK